MNLPEMSVIDTHLPSNTKIRGYTTEQMLAWGKACAAAEREMFVEVLRQLHDSYSLTSNSNAIRARRLT